MAAVAEWAMGIEEQDMEIDGNGDGFVEEGRRCRELSTAIDRGAWRAVVITRRRLTPGGVVAGSGIVSSDGKWEYFGSGIGWGDGVKVLSGEEKAKEDQLLFYMLSGWKADMEGLDFVLKMPDSSPLKSESKWMISKVDVEDLRGHRAWTFRGETS